MQVQSALGVNSSLHFLDYFESQSSICTIRPSRLISNPALRSQVCSPARHQNSTFSVGYMQSRAIQSLDRGRSSLSV